MSDRQDAFEQVCRHCDLRERLALVPASAMVRGMYFSAIEVVLSRAGKLDAYRALYPERFSTMRWYPTVELLPRLAIGAALLTSAERVHEGMFEIGRRNALALAESLLGRTMLRLLSRDPVKLLRQGLAGRRQSNRYGEWELSFPTERSAVMRMTSEVLYIESYLLGAAQGTFDLIPLPVRAQVVLDDRFNGMHILEW